MITEDPDVACAACGKLMLEHTEPCAEADNVLHFRGQSYADVLGEPHPDDFDPGAPREGGYGRTPQVPPGSEQAARFWLHVAMRDQVERVVEGKHVLDFRRFSIPISHVTSSLPACLEWCYPNGAREGIPWDRVAGWRADPVEGAPYPPPGA